jgi:hypothetical protein
MTDIAGIMDNTLAHANKGVASVIYDRYERHGCRKYSPTDHVRSQTIRHARRYINIQPRRSDVKSRDQRMLYVPPIVV